MKNYKFIIILIILKLFNISISTPLSPGNCPEKCTCDLDDNELIISACNQINTPFLLPSDFTLDPDLANVTSIHAVGCLIQEFPTNICHYQNLTFINLALNQITSLSSSNFDCIQGLTKINMASNRISDINGIFNKLDNLSVLDLKNNSISQITEAAFNNLKSLESLVLSYNHIKSLPSNVFKGLSNLQQLDITYNNITQIDDNYFNGLFKIKSLYLSNNQISKLSNNSFNSLNSLQNLFISNNQINQSLNSLFINLTNLLELDLSSNQMTTMELWPTYLTNLSVLLLRFNKIEKFTNELGWSIQNSENLPQLQDFIVDLEFNNIAEFSDETIEQYGINTFNDFSLFINKYFKVFNIDNNPINCDCRNSVKLTGNSIALINTNSTLNQSQLYSSKCKFPEKYAGKSVLTFDNCISTGNENYFSKYLVTSSFLLFLLINSIIS